MASSTPTSGAWANTTPPVKAKLVSTHLTSCSVFLALTPEEKLAAVLGNAACLHCAAWDHAVHKFPGGKATNRDPKCSAVVAGVVCGGQHGRWYHNDGKTGTTNSVVAAASTHAPGLYEVYSVSAYSQCRSRQARTSGRAC